MPFYANCAVAFRLWDSNPGNLDQFLASGLIKFVSSPSNILDSGLRAHVLRGPAMIPDHITDELKSELIKRAFI